MAKVRSFMVEILNILRQVTWPDKDTLVQLTIVVIFVSAVVGLYLGAVDFGLTKMLGILSVGR
jgi:preprotein translocase SecE subunit